MTDWLLITLPIVCLLGLAATHVLLLRTYPAIRPYSAYGRAFLAWLVIEVLFDVVGARYFSANQWLRYGPANLASYVVLAYCYFHFFNLGETGRRMRLLIELRAHAEGLTLAELLSRYSAKELIQRRIDRLLMDGQVIQKNGKFISNGKTMSSIAELIAWLRRMVMGPPQTS